MTLTRYKRLIYKIKGNFLSIFLWAEPCEQRVHMAFSVYQVSGVVGLFTR